jgi:hypothetical protein
LTTVRERIENGQFHSWIINHFVNHKGQVPLCCHSSKKTKKGWIMNCTWLRSQGIKDLTFPEFQSKCLECQKEIERQIKEYDKAYSSSN